MSVYITSCVKLIGLNSQYIFTKKSSSVQAYLDLRSSRCTAPKCPKRNQFFQSLFPRAIPHPDEVSPIFPGEDRLAKRNHGSLARQEGCTGYRKRYDTKGGIRGNVGATVAGKIISSRNGSKRDTSKAWHRNIDARARNYFSRVPKSHASLAFARVPRRFSRSIRCIKENPPSPSPSPLFLHLARYLPPPPLQRGNTKQSTLASCFEFSSYGGNVLLIRVVVANQALSPTPASSLFRVRARNSNNAILPVPSAFCRYSHIVNELNEVTSLRVILETEAKEAVGSLTLAWINH